MFSVLASPGGKLLVEVASEDPGGRGREQFHSVGAHARAVLDGLPLGRSVANEPVKSEDVDDEGNEDWSYRPLAPLRISRAVGPALMDATLAFYGVNNNSNNNNSSSSSSSSNSNSSSSAAAALGFGAARVLLDETDAATGDRAVTVMLSPNATVHLQLWARSEEVADDANDDGGAFPTDEDFSAAVGSNQVNGGQPASAAGFCEGGGRWTVARYNQYLLKTHASVMTTLDPQQQQEEGRNRSADGRRHSSDGDDTINNNDDDGGGGDTSLHPPAGNSMDVFVDDHLSWDCTSPLDCDEAAAGAALYGLGLHVQWLGSDEAGWTAYTHDPAGYGVELHWFAAPDGFRPSGVVHPNCFSPFAANGTCSGAFRVVD